MQIAYFTIGGFEYATVWPNKSPEPTPNGRWGWQSKGFSWAWFSFHTLDLTTFMDIINITAIVVGPLLAVLITLWWQERKEHRDAKRRLFLTLMAKRRAIPPTIEWVDALNVIDVVFADELQVVQLWHEYYAGLANPPANQNYEHREHTYLLMLSAMARSLGYRRLEQTDIDKFYSPQVHGDQAQLNWKCQTEWLRVLEGTNRLSVEPKTPEQKAIGGSREV